MFRLQCYRDARSLAGGHRSDLFHEGEGSQPPASVSYSCSLLTWLTLALSLALASVYYFLSSGLGEGLLPIWRKALEELKRADLWLGLGGMVDLASTMTTTGQHQTALRTRACLFVAPSCLVQL